MSAKSLSGSIITLSVVHDNCYFRFPLTFPLQFISQVTVSIAARGSTGGITTLRGQTSHFRPQRGSLSTASTLSGNLSGNFKLSGTIAASSIVGPITVFNQIALKGTILATSIAAATIKGSYAIAGSIEATSGTTGITTAVMALVGIIRANTGITGNIISSVAVTSTCISITNVHGRLYKLIYGYSETDSNVGVPQVMGFPWNFPFSFDYAFEQQSMAAQGQVETFSNVSAARVNKSIKGISNSATITSGTLTGIFKLSGGTGVNSVLFASSDLSINAAGSINANSTSTATIRNSIALSGKLEAFSGITVYINNAIACIGQASSSSELSGNIQKLIYGETRTAATAKITQVLGFPWSFPFGFNYAYEHLDMEVSGDINTYSIIAPVEIHKQLTCNIKSISSLTGDLAGTFKLTSNIVTASSLSGILYKLVSGGIIQGSHVGIPQVLGFPWSFPFNFNYAYEHMTIEALGDMQANSGTLPAIATKQLRGSSHSISSLYGTVSNGVNLIANIDTSSSVTGALNKLISGKLTQTSHTGIAYIFGFPWNFPVNFNYAEQMHMNTAGEIVSISYVPAATILKIKKVSIAGIVQTKSILTGTISDHKKITGSCITTSSLNGRVSHAYVMAGIKIKVQFNVNVTTNTSITQNCSSNEIIAFDIKDTVQMIKDIKTTETITSIQQSSAVSFTQRESSIMETEVYIAAAHDDVRIQTQLIKDINIKVSVSFTTNFKEVLEHIIKL